MRCPHCGGEVPEKPKLTLFPQPDGEYLRRYIEQMEKRRREQMDPLDRLKELQR